MGFQDHHGEARGHQAVHAFFGEGRVGVRAPFRLLRGGDFAQLLAEPVNGGDEIVRTGFERGTNRAEATGDGAADIVEVDGGDLLTGDLDGTPRALFGSMILDFYFRRETTQLGCEN